MEETKETKQEERAERKLKEELQEMNREPSHADLVASFAAISAAITYAPAPPRVRFHRQEPRRIVVDPYSSASAFPSSCHYRRIQSHRFTISAPPRHLRRAQPPPVSPTAPSIIL
jgi:hypothetical protein